MGLSKQIRCVKQRRFARKQDDASSVTTAIFSLLLNTVLLVPKIIWSSMNTLIEDVKFVREFLSKLTTSTSATTKTKVKKNNKEKKNKKSMDQFWQLLQ